MTLHSAGKWYSNHRCSNCDVLYIPYNINMSCPKCGEKEQLECDFIDLAVRSLNINLRQFKLYIPPAWSVISFSDDILLRLFIIFEMYKNVKDLNKFRLAVKREIKKNKKVDRYFKKHFVLMAVFVKAVLENRKNNSSPVYKINIDEIKNFQFE